MRVRPPVRVLGAACEGVGAAACEGGGGRL